ncbi:MAG: four helix bundle protein [Bacteroidota bacterium]
MSEQGYRGLEIYQRAHKLAVDIHRMTLTLPKFEMYEEGSQIRRSAKSVAAQIVEGYCLRRNKKEFIQYLNRAYASAHETVEHLDILAQTGSLTDDKTYNELRSEYDVLCKMTFRFMEGVSEGHEKLGFVKETEVMYPAQPTSHISHPKSE